MIDFAIDEAAVDAVEQAMVASYMAPPPRLSVSEWADQFRQLSREASAEPGQWKTDRAPYQRGILDAFSDPDVETVVVMSSSQIGKTEILLNLIGYYAHQDPAPILAVLPTIGDAEQWSKTRIAPMIRDTPALRERFKDPRSRDSGNTILVKEYPGGHLTMVGSNAASGLAAKPIRVVLGDEIDRFAASAGTEGDPISLAKRRAATFWNRKYGWFSTPTLKGTRENPASRIEAAFWEGDQRFYLVPCPDCDTFQRLVWSNLRWEEGHPATAQYLCQACGVLIPEAKKLRMLQRGRWEATAATKSRTASFHLSALYSPWARWAELVGEFLAAQQSLERLQVFVNTILGETWEERGGGLDPSALESRREAYGPAVPSAVAAITMGVDVQDDRIEYVVRGWGRGEESWLLEHDRILGDPSIGIGKPDSPWDELERRRATPRQTDDGRQLPVMVTCVDSGYHTDAVYAYTGPRSAKRVWAIKGSSTPGAPLLPRRPSRNNKARVPVFLLGTAAAKDLVYARLKIVVAGPLYMHIPDWAAEDWFAQVTAERVVKRQVSGRWFRRYELPKGMRNEVLDCEVYALAAIRLAPMQLSAWTPPDRPVAEPATEAPVTPGASPTAEEAPAVDPPKARPRYSKPSSWATRW